MTEADDGNFLVKVRAQVMTRDDSSGGWVPMSGGGLATVAVKRRFFFVGGHQPNNTNGAANPSSSSNVTSGPSTSNSTHTNSNTNSSAQPQPSTSTATPVPANRRFEYLIYGKRITDQSIVLSCTIKRDFEYNKVMPTFHHWRTGEKKFGLTFQTAADARAFDKGVRTAVEELLEGLAESSLRDGRIDAGNDDVFMALNLPVEPPEPPREPRPSPDPPRGSARLPSYSQNADLPDPHRPIHYIGGTSARLPQLHQPLESVGGPSARILQPLDSMGGSTIRLPSPHQPMESIGSSSIRLPPPNQPLGSIGGSSVRFPLSHHPLETNTDAVSDNYPYVQLTTLNHEYLYPVIEERKGDRYDRRCSTSSLKKPDVIVSQPAKNAKRNIRLRCKHCQELYSEQHNPRGTCEYSPDPIRRGIATISCLSCAQCMLYHCMSDAEGDFAQNPCSCSTEEGCGRRWLGLGLLSIVVPCLWFYPPLRAIHWCGMYCGLCGGRHHPME